MTKSLAELDAELSAKSNALRERLAVIEVSLRKKAAAGDEVAETLLLIMELNGLARGAS